MKTMTFKEYEEALYQKILYDFLDFPQVRVVHNDRVRGRFSLWRRQLDTALYRRGEDRPFFVADAKRYGRRIEVTDIESFMGMLEDVGAEGGLLASPLGASKPAQRRRAPASIHLEMLSFDEALELNWCKVAQLIFPWDWAFHRDIAKGLHRLEQGQPPEAVIEAIEQVPFEEWEAVVAYCLVRHRAEAAEFLWFVAQHHYDDGWRFNALRHLMDADLLCQPKTALALQNENDPEILELLEEWNDTKPGGFETPEGPSR